MTVPAEQQDRKLETKLREELPGILAWAVAGCVSWQRSGLAIPAAVRAASDEYRAEMDHLGQFLDERCALEPSATAPAADVYVAYKSWCETQGIARPRTLPKFWMKLAERGIKKTRSRHGITYVGIRLGVPHDY